MEKVGKQRRQLLCPHFCNIDCGTSAGQWCTRMLRLMFGCRMDCVWSIWQLPTEHVRRDPDPFSVCPLAKVIAFIWPHAPWRTVDLRGSISHTRSFTEWNRYFKPKWPSSIWQCGLNDLVAQGYSHVILLVCTITGAQSWQVLLEYWLSITSDKI
jgi:hypothetical protein